MASPGRRGGSRRWPGGSRRWHARRRRGVCPPGREEDDRGGGDGLGRAAGPGGLPGERQVILLSFISVLILFSISAICF